MENYTTFCNTPSPRASTNLLYEDFSGGFWPHNERSSSEGSKWSFWKLFSKRAPKTPPPESGYLTLIPLSDSRLKPRHTKFIVTTLVITFLAALSAVFVLVPRGVSAGAIDIRSTKMSFNTTTSTYRIVLLATIPIYNPNYLEVAVNGQLNVSFYDHQAGTATVSVTPVKRRSNPEVLEVRLDVDRLPAKYTQVIYSQCFTFPRKLIFFMLADLEATYMRNRYRLPRIDTYFMLDCNGGSGVLRGGEPQGGDP